MKIKEFMTDEEYQKQLERSRKYYHEHKEENRERKKAYSKEWHRKNKDRHNEMMKRVYKKTKAKYLARQKTLKYIGIPEGLICQNCHINLAIQRHHPDYSKPFDILFVCKKCNENLPSILIPKL
jgi:hypothetical protein